MADEAVVAVPSTAEPMELPRSGTDAYAQWRIDGTIPAKPSEAQTVESPATDTPKAETAADPDPATGKKQESRRKPDAEARIRELTDRQKQLERELEEYRKPKEAKADPPPAKQPETTRPKPKTDDQVDGKNKYASYEDYVEDLADWKAEQRIASREREQAQAQQLQSTKQKLDEARTRYDDYDSKAIPVVQELLKEGVSREVFSVLNDSPVLADLLYTIGGNDDTKADFLKAARENPGKALRVALLMEQEIVKELAKGTESSNRDEKGKFVKAEVETPVKRGPESAPKPPIEIGNRGAGAGDDYAQALSDLDAGKPGAFQRLKALDDARDLRARRGA
jgi:hypothetical protein